MEDMQFSCHVQAKNKATHKCTIGANKGIIDRFLVHKTTIPKLRRLAPQQMDGRRENSFNCDKKYSKGYKCGGKKLFYIECEEEEDEELELPQDIDLEETTPTISCHALASLNTPQTHNI